MSYLPDFNETRALRDPAPAWRWVVRMPDLVPMGGGSSATLEGLAPVSQAPFGRVSSIDFGVRQIDSDQRFKAGKRVNFPRFITMPSVNITFIEDVDYSVMRYLRSWSNLIYDENGNYGVSADYKFTITLFAFDTISNTRAVMVGFMRGCWPTNLSGLQYAYDSGSGPVTLSTEFAVDEDIVQLGGVVGGLYGAADFLTTFGGAFDQFSNFASSFGFGDLGLGGITDFLGDVQSGVRSVQNTVRQAQNQFQRIISAPNQIAGQVRNGIQSVQGQVRQVASLPNQAARQASSTVSSFRSITGGFRF